MADAGHADVLAIIAHPDDEVFASGTLCLLSEQGLVIDLVCVTDGEGGSDALLRPGQGREALGRIRRHEVTLSAWMLGVRRLDFLGLADTPPDGWGEAEPWDVASLVVALAEIIRARRPQLILTHGPKGGYGHPAHRCVSRCVLAAADAADFDGSVFSFAAQVRGAFFSWRFDDPAQVVIDARGFLRRRAASLSYHQSEAQFFLSPYAPRTPRRLASAALGIALQLTEFGRKRLPVITAERFFRRFPKEGLALLRAPPQGRPHFFAGRLADDPRVTLTGAGATP